MRVLDSTTFRKTYAKLTEPVEIQSHGRVIGMWVPAHYRLPPDTVLGSVQQRPKLDLTGYLETGPRMQLSDTTVVMDDEDAVWMNAALGPVSVPGKYPPDHTIEPGGAPRSTSTPQLRPVVRRRVSEERAIEDRPFNSKPFTPVPKTGKKK